MQATHVNARQGSLLPVLGTTNMVLHKFCAQSAQRTIHPPPPSRITKQRPAPVPVPGSVPLDLVPMPLCHPRQQQGGKNITPGHSGIQTCECQGQKSWLRNQPYYIYTTAHLGKMMAAVITPSSAHLQISLKASLALSNA